MRISDWSSDVCSSDLGGIGNPFRRKPCRGRAGGPARDRGGDIRRRRIGLSGSHKGGAGRRAERKSGEGAWHQPSGDAGPVRGGRSEEHTSELESLMRISYADFCLKKKTHKLTR